MCNQMNAQTPATGVWLPVSTANPNPSTTTMNDVGVGTTTPRGKQEIIYCPTTTPQDGLIVNAKDCGPFLPNTGVNPNILFGEVNPDIPIPTISILPFIRTIPSSFSSNMVKSNIFWLRTETHDLMNPSSNFNTHFIVNNQGRVGTNIMNPRATFDVVQDVSGTMNNTPTAIFSKRNPGAGSALSIGNNLFGVAFRTRQMLFFNRLGSGAYNGIVQNGDQAIIISDGMGPNGSNLNLNAGFVIAPWGTNGYGGLRMEANGNTELRGNLRAPKVVVDAQWWPDFVFHSNYNLMPLQDVKTYIQKHSHLPGMPSQDSVLNNGQDVGELQKLQQQKIEELTLYSIAQDEKLKAQEAKLHELEQKLNAILNK